MELQINKYLVHNSISCAVDFFAHKLKTEHLSVSDSQVIVFFLQANKQKKSVYNWLLRQLKNDIKFSLAHLYWLLQDSQLAPRLEALLVQAITTSNYDCSVLQKNTKWIKLNSLIDQAREKRQNDLQILKETLIEKIQYYKANNMPQDYEESVYSLTAKFSADKDPTVEAILADFKLDHLEYVLTKTTAKYNKQKQQIKEETLFRNVAYKTHLIAASKNLSKKNPQLSYDLALMAQSLKLHQLSEDILLSDCEQNQDVLWLRVYSLVESKKFLKALDLVDSHLTVIKPKHLVDYNYLKALAWKALGNTQKALDLLDEILLFKNNYRQAKMLKQLYTQDQE